MTREPIKAVHSSTARSAPIHGAPINHRQLGIGHASSVSLLLIIACIAPRTAFSQTLQFVQATPRPGTTVFFNPSRAVKILRSELPESLVPILSEDHKYVVFLDKQSYLLASYNQFKFDVYIRSNPDGPNVPVYRFAVKEEPHGTFPDSLADIVSVNITDHGQTDTASLKLIPLHSVDSPNLQIPSPDKSYSVPIGSEGRIRLPFTNTLNDLHVELPNQSSEVKIDSDSCQDCWDSKSATFEDLHLSAKASTLLLVDLHPNTWAIFKHTIFPTELDTEQENLRLVLTSKSEYEGFPVTQSFVIPIRFVPAPHWLGLCLLIGSCTGVFVRWVWSQRKREGDVEHKAAGEEADKPRKPEVDTEAELAGKELDKPFTWSRAIERFCAALLVWLIALLTKTKVSIWAHELDPTGLVPALLITFSVAAGLSKRFDEVIDIIKGLLP